MMFLVQSAFGKKASHIMAVCLFVFQLKPSVSSTVQSFLDPFVTTKVVIIVGSEDPETFNNIMIL